MKLCVKAISCTFHICEVKTHQQTTKINQTQGKKYLANIPATWFLPLTAHLRSLRQENTHPANHQVRRKCLWLDLQKKKRTTTTVESIGKITKEKRNWIQPDQSVFRKNITRRFDAFFFNRKPTGSPTFPSCWGSLFDFIVAGPKFRVQSIDKRNSVFFLALFPGGKKQTSIDVSSAQWGSKVANQHFRII